MRNDLTLPSGRKITNGDALTEREIEVMRRHCMGCSRDQIAKIIGISSHTVKFHLRNCYVKLGAVNGAHAAVIFVGRYT